MRTFFGELFRLSFSHSSSPQAATGLTSFAISGWLYIRTYVTDIKFHSRFSEKIVHIEAYIFLCITYNLNIICSSYEANNHHKRTFNAQIKYNDSHKNWKGEMKKKFH